MPPQSVQFTTSNGLVSSVPVARRTLIPSASGSSFSATLTSSVSRGAGQIKTFFVRVPRGLNDLDVSVAAMSPRRKNGRPEPPGR